MVKIFRRPLPILAAALAISCALTAFWILKLEWTLPWLRLFDRPDSLPLDALMVQNNTLPRMAMALLAGGSTAMATMLMQQLMRNPLASDSTLAVSSGAQAALVAATVFAPSLPTARPPWRLPAQRRLWALYCGCRHGAPCNRSASCWQVWWSACIWVPSPVS